MIKDLFKSITIEKLTDYSSEFIYVSGIVDHLKKMSLFYMADKLGFNFIYSIRNNSDIRKYLRSLEVINSKKNAFTMAGMEVTLEENAFEKASKVSTRGEWGKKGDLLYLWPIAYSHPIRISYFGDEIEYIEIYDEVYGNKIQKIDDFIIGDLNKLPDKVDWHKISLTGVKNINSNYKLLFSQYSIDSPDAHEIKLDYSFPQLYYKRFDLLALEVQRLEQVDWDIMIVTNHKDELGTDLGKYVVDEDKLGRAFKNLGSGFTSQSNKVLFLTDRELFGTIFLEKERKKLTTKQAQKILEQLEGEIEIDDYIVHEDHGVGVYKGIKQEKFFEYKTINFQEIKVERIEEYLSIEYAENDELLTPISQIQKITKYIGTTEEMPEITRLHKGNWKVAIRKARKAVELIAKDLVKHYAKVHLAKIESIDYEDTQFYKEFEEDFPYEETRDQKNAIDDIKKDLSRDVPMDRLIVGDVGFGKTEVAMRAAFKVVESGKQVAVLCPTTVLAAQHHQVFKDRFKNSGASIGYVSRFNTPAQNKLIIEKAAEGSIDVLVGTHRLLSNDVDFMKLGLIIIDEEQKFGVKQKEKIKELQYNAHSLTLTATPIPRTLSMALSQIKEISIIATPPSGRRSVVTTVNKINWVKVKQEIMHEFKRGGQAYFLHNRVETIESIKHKMEQLMPEVRFAIGHGQMTGKMLDTVITDFYAEEFDVLICTTIIENGIDMPNVNTIIINDGQNFGLGQLYQLRGRVGRSDKQAYCYIYYKGDDVEKNKLITTKVFDKKKKKKKPLKYIERLKAIMEAQELGSGFKIASRDLEIRGAGNLLGKQQHGNIKNVGLALYMQMLAEEIEKLKHEEDELEIKE